MIRSSGNTNLSPKTKQRETLKVTNEDGVKREESRRGLVDLGEGRTSQFPLHFSLFSPVRVVGLTRFHCPVRLGGSTHPIFKFPRYGR